ncbi:hypothetical protein [Pasteurella sp. PK-2025]|uniref:hypothetical protein n=1 Tax=Pasteurella sp. PK-2025 TaxID=3413133 RepID=UPI003C72413F
MKKIILYVLTFLSPLLQANNIKYDKKALYGDWHCQIENKDHNTKVMTDYRFYKNGKVQSFSMLRFPADISKSDIMGMLHYSYIAEGSWKLDQEQIIVTTDIITNLKKDHNSINKMLIETDPEMKQLDNNLFNSLQNKTLLGVSDKLIIQIKLVEKNENSDIALFISNNVAQGFCLRPLNPEIWTEYFEQIFPKK